MAAQRSPAGHDLAALGTPRLLRPPELVREGGRVREASVPPLVPPRLAGSLADIPFENAEQAPDDVVFARLTADGAEWRDVTCAEFAGEVMAVAKGLLASGLKPGERLAIMAPTSYEWTLVDFAAWAAGLITVPLYPGSSAGQVRTVLRDAYVSALLVADVEDVRLVSAIRGTLPDLRHLWQLDNGAVGQLAAAGRQIPDALVNERRAALGPDTVATLIYTSGTTGRPRGCVLTHGNFHAGVDNAIQLLHPVFERVSDEPAATLLFLPLAHVFGRMVSVGCQRARVRQGHASSVRTDELLADLGSFRPTFLLAIPHVLEKVYNTARATAESMGRAGSFDRAARIATRWGDAWSQGLKGEGRGPGVGLRTARGLYDALVYKRVRAALGGRVRHVICGGSPLGERLGAFYAGAGIEVYEGYGLTETTAAVTVTPPLRPKLGTVGWPMPGMAVRIADDGEVLLRGGQVFYGYWDARDHSVPKETDADGWFATGDLGALDDEGYLTITGRKKELIVTSGGKNVAPAPLEDWLRAHPLVDQAVVVGDGRPYLVALLTLDQDGLAHWRRTHRKQGLPMRELVRDGDLLHNLQQAVNEANGLVSRAESIRRFAVLPVRFTVERGQLTPSLKLRRARIAADFEQEVAELYRVPDDPA
ncbi:AMP-dependent synthetase/ligase [Streptomyces alkaliterrae]|uniref:AMP-binding protein n=1 Tax=Streptomyces alkaliterrae TaxID=2213162 RepID=A0A5P0YT90_9ACTN|nr:AMP-dependent synthetase/ligase [Streptomyces alkaliterrae]MBB1260447.1 AMP-binding protein [Streptomyces alkaliterrae]MQS03488.1 AMP-binding protein [Streptomyces alkaliterrae]